MTAKEYLRQAWNIDQHIKDKLEQITRLKEMATNVTSVISDMPGSATRNDHKLDDIVSRIADMEREIDESLSRQMSLQLDIMQTIWKVEDANCRTLLDMRYIRFMSWEEIAVAMKVSIRWVHMLHAKALRALESSDRRFTKVH